MTYEIKRPRNMETKEHPLAKICSLFEDSEISIDTVELVLGLKNPMAFKPLMN